MRWWLGRRQLDVDLERELRSHLDLETEEQQAAGLSARDARHAARRAFGNATLIQEEVRALGRWTKMEQIAQDARYALRGLKRSLGFSTVTILSLALGIGATTAVFSVLNAVALRPLPVPGPHQLVVLKPELRGKRFPLFNPLFEELARTQKTLAGMFAISDEPYLKVAFDGGAATYVHGSLVSGNYFEVLGMSPALGRLLTAADDEPSAADCAAVVSHSFWVRRLESQPSALGRRLVVREKVCTIVGVAPEGFSSHDAGYSVDLWVPLRVLTDPKLLASRTMAFYTGVMGRLRPDTSEAQAEAELTSLYHQLQAADPQPSPFPGDAPPKPSDFSLRVAPGAQGLNTVRGQFGQPLTLALAAVGVVLLIASVNVANLLLARGAARSTELATRAALGAGRSRLVRLLVIEGAVLVLLAGIVGVAIAFLAAPALSKTISISYRPIAIDTAPDIRVLGVAIASTLLATLLAGFVPALRLSGTHLAAGMSGGTRTTGSRGSQRLTRALVAAQLGLSLMLVTAAGLLFRTILRVMSVDPGFKAANVILMDVRDTEAAARFGEVDSLEAKARRAAEYLALDRRLNTIPAVQAASISWLGLFGGNYVGLNLYEADLPGSGRFTLVDYVAPRYFDAVGMELMRGRGFTDDDREGSIRVAIVNEAFARERTSGREAIGRRFVMTYGDDRRPFTIVGIVRDAKYNDLREGKTEPMMWVPIAQVPVKITSIALKVQPEGEAAAIREARAALAAISPYLMERKVMTLRNRVDQATARERLLLRLASAFAGMALLLAAIGLYGTLAYAVIRRTREIGVRLALGAQRGTLLFLVLRDSLALVAAGMLAGIPLSLAAGHLLRAFLFGVKPYNLLQLFEASAVLAAVGLAAAFVPARRASHVDPILALKYE